MPEDSFVRFEGQDISKYLPLSNKFTDLNQIEFLAHTAAEEDIQPLGDQGRIDHQTMETNLPGFSSNDLTELLDILVAENHMMTYTNNDATYFASRVGELVRNITCLHEFQNEILFGKILKAVMMKMMKSDSLFDYGWYKMGTKIEVWSSKSNLSRQSD